MLRRPRRLAWGGLSLDQLAVLGDVLAREPGVGRDEVGKLELEDPDAPGARLQWAWNNQGNRMTVSMIPVTAWDGDAPAVTISADQVTELRAFVVAGPPA